MLRSVRRMMLAIGFFATLGASSFVAAQAGRGQLGVVVGHDVTSALFHLVRVFAGALDARVPLIAQLPVRPEQHLRQNPQQDQEEHELNDQRPIDVDERRSLFWRARQQGGKKHLFSKDAAGQRRDALNTLAAQCQPSGYVTWAETSASPTSLARGGYFLGGVEGDAGVTADDGVELELELGWDAAAARPCSVRGGVAAPRFSILLKPSKMTPLSI